MKKSAWILPVLAIGGWLMFSCNNQQEKKERASGITIPDRNGFRDTIDGKATDLFVLTNSRGMKLAITNYGGRFVSLLVPDQKGTTRDVVVGFREVQDYRDATEPYFGATIGRFGNRIGKAQFKLDGKQFTLSSNNGANTLHGGTKGFQYVVWDARQPDDSTLELSYLSKDGEEGFPGNLRVKVVYALTADNAVTMDYEATTDKPTVVNLTNHPFFNLNGEGSGSVNKHLMQIDAHQYTPVDSTLIPTGKEEDVSGTPFDFTRLTEIGSRLDNAKNLQLKYGKGYDHNFVLADALSDTVQHAATVIGDQSGIRMDVYTTEPGLQFYGGNFMQSKNTFKSGAKDDFRTAFCLETQHFPDSPNQPVFPSTVLRPGEVYRSHSVYRFSLSAE